MRVVLGDGVTVAALLTHLGYDDREQRSLSILVNGDKVELARTLTAGDTVALLLLVGGG